MAGGYGWNLAPVAARSFISHWRAWRGRGSMSGKGIVHLVDDEESLRRSTSFVLKNSGYGVVTSEFGPAFMQQVVHDAQGCVLLAVGKMAVWGRWVSVSVSMGDRRLIKQKTIKNV